MLVRILNPGGRQNAAPVSLKILTVSLPYKLHNCPQNEVAQLHKSIFKAGVWMKGLGVGASACICDPDGWSQKSSLLTMRESIQ